MSVRTHLNQLFLWYAHKGIFCQTYVLLCCRSGYCAAHALILVDAQVDLQIHLLYTIGWCYRLRRR